VDSALPPPQVSDAERPARFLVVGLGNPGPEYEDTYHNLGFRVVELLAERNRIRVTRPDSGALTGEGSIEGRPVLLAKPQTFMNLSGTCVRRLMEKHSFTAAEVIAVYDELDLPWNSMRIRPKGSAGGHNGVKSLIGCLGTNEFARVRLGIHPGHPVRDGADFVLSRIGKGQRKELDEMLEQAAKAVESIIAEGVVMSMTKFNRRAQGSTLEEE
jgi:peptidyl-tRNA hydrolase, PTH1 family